ncbi:MAPEG family protein [Aquabacterium sp. A7-Y]|uniref:MAPEG family protein n=1 Tax=Aquabacterium sp. A7-Y TaxID=1349605 RepID=UPI00223E83F5|nr:MAPEG family protein [Aquabacterium sp. A7-Y]MCW7536834.1 MAPEG family protein [Aquabacterium sp. A7-Y]
MLVLPISLTTAGLCTLLYLVLSVRVVLQRKKSDFAVTATMDKELLIRIRVHGNFAEYVPLALLLLALLELAAAPQGLLWCLGAVLIIARICHALGLPRPAPNVLRLLGVLGTFGTLLVECAAALYVLLR